MRDIKKVTIKDVAKKAAVSPSTVSRVISGNSRISRATTDRVTRCMEELGFYPNAIARSLANRTSRTIGLVMPDKPGEALSNPFFPEALRGILKASAGLGYDVLLSSHQGNDVERLVSIKSMINASKVDGILLMTSRSDDDLIKYLKSLDFPFSVIGSPYEGTEIFNHADNDNFLAAYELVRYLISKKFTKLAIIAGGRELTVTKHRLEGFVSALEDANIKYDPSNLQIGEFNEDTGYRFGLQLAESESDVDAVIATDDVLAFGVATALRERGRKIPEDIAIASFNNSILSRRCHTPLTSIEIHPDRLGEEAVKLLVSAIENGTRGLKVIIPHSILKRLSTEG
jgi:DNA-binding LacI/PurR family transcriptional regulator